MCGLSELNGGSRRVSRVGDAALLSEEILGYCS